MEFRIMEPCGKKLIIAAGTPAFKTKEDAKRYLAECPSFSYKCTIKAFR